MKEIDEEAKPEEPTASRLIFLHEAETIYKDEECTEVDAETHTAKYHKILEQLEEWKGKGIHAEHGSDRTIGTVYPMAIW